MTAVNRLLRRLGVLLVPLPPSAKMLREHANVSECHHPSRGGNTVAWMRRVADILCICGTRPDGRRDPNPKCGDHRG